MISDREFAFALAFIVAALVLVVFVCWAFAWKDHAVEQSRFYDAAATREIQQLRILHDICAGEVSYEEGEPGRDLRIIASCGRRP